MKTLLLIVLASACATTAGPKHADESHRIPVNRTTPIEVESALRRNQVTSVRRGSQREGEVLVEWR